MNLARVRFFVLYAATGDVQIRKTTRTERERSFPVLATHGEDDANNARTKNMDDYISSHPYNESPEYPDQCAICGCEKEVHLLDENEV